MAREMLSRILGPSASRLTLDKFLTPAKSAHTQVWLHSYWYLFEWCFFKKPFLPFHAALIMKIRVEWHFFNHVINCLIVQPNVTWWPPGWAQCSWTPRRAPGIFPSLLQHQKEEGSFQRCLPLSPPLSVAKKETQIIDNTPHAPHLSNSI